MADKPCKDCPPGSIRPTPYPGPRCHTHHLAFKRAARERARNRHVERVFGLTAEQYKALWEFQGGRCFICLGAGGGRAFAVDHDHATGQVRGLLCAVKCNYELLGRFDLAALERAVDYLRNPPYGRMNN